jgi:cytochrome c oxidase subunit 1
MYNETVGKIHFWLSAIFINLTFFPQHFAGLAGMQRRVPDYNAVFTDFNEWSTIGAFGFFAAQLLMIYNFGRCVWFRKGMAPAPARVWEGAHGLEWTVPSPAPYHTFETPPNVAEGEITVIHDEEDALDHHKLGLGK